MNAQDIVAWGKLQPDKYFFGGGAYHALVRLEKAFWPRWVRQDGVRFVRLHCC